MAHNYILILASNYIIFILYPIDYDLPYDSR